LIEFFSKREASKVLSPICGNPREMIDIAREKPARKGGLRKSAVAFHHGV
jgi:hypothetical protein